jgi:hypothetical protein
MWGTHEAIKKAPRYYRSACLSKFVSGPNYFSIFLGAFFAVFFAFFAIYLFLLTLLLGRSPLFVCARASYTRIRVQSVSVKKIPQFSGVFRISAES